MKPLSLAIDHPLESDTLRILKLAKAILQKRVYQTKYIAAMDTGDTASRMVKGVRVVEPVWDSVSPLLPDAMLSLRGAVIAAAGIGRLAWPVLERMERDGGLPCIDPVNKARALRCLDLCIQAEEDRLRDGLEGLPATRALAEAV
jgi:hypothetical protein